MQKIIAKIIEYFGSHRITEQYPKWIKQLSQLQKKLDYQFNDVTLLQAAMTHKSYLRKNFNDHKTPSPFERMEFLGDSILGFVVAKELFLRYPDEQEGKLSKLKSKIVSTTYLTLKAQLIDLGKYILLSPEEQESGGAEKPSILSDGMEALICAIYLDSGIAMATRFIKGFILKDYETVVTRNDLVNYKSMLQEHLQSRNQLPPDYVTVAEQGPEHKKLFTVEVHVGNKTMGTGKGANKKAAQQEAARLACQKLGI